MLGLWIDSLSPVERDAIIQHPDPTYGGANYWNEERQCACLVGCVVAVSPASRLMAHRCRHECLQCDHAPESPFWQEVASRFPHLTYRFGAERMWRVVKQRAAKGNRIPLETPALEAVGD